MYSRLKQLAKPKRRHLIISSLYFVYALLAIANLAVYGSSLSVIDLAILVPAITMLATAITQVFARNIHTVATDDGNDNEDAAQKASEDAKRCIRPSSHNIINASLHLGASSCFITFDALILANAVPFPPTPTLAGIICRETGSAAWCAAAFISLFHSVAHDRKKENHPHDDVKAWGIHPSFYNLTIEVLFLAACALYGYEIFTESELNKIRAANICMWGAAGLIAVPAAIYDVYTRNDKKTTPAVIELQNEDRRDVVIRISSPDESQFPSNIFLQRPRMTF